MAVETVCCEPVSAGIPCLEQKRQRALYPRHQIGIPPESDVISVSYPKISVELMRRFCGSGVVFAVAIRESRLSFGGIALSLAGIGLHACGIRLRDCGIALSNAGSALSLCGAALPLSGHGLPLGGIRLSNSEKVRPQAIQRREQAQCPRPTAHRGGRIEAPEFPGRPRFGCQSAAPGRH